MNDNGNLGQGYFKRTFPNYSHINKFSPEKVLYWKININKTKKEIPPTTTILPFPLDSLTSCLLLLFNERRLNNPRIDRTNVRQIKKPLIFIQDIMLLYQYRR